MRFKRPTVIESEPAIMNNYALMGLLVVMIAFMWWSSRSRKKQMEKMEEEKREQLAAVTPGKWVRTRVGFWGRFVDLDGDIVVLETTDGHEMYWEREMIAEIAASRPSPVQKKMRRPRAPTSRTPATRARPSWVSTTPPPRPRTPTSSRSKSSRLNGK